MKTKLQLVQAPKQEPKPYDEAKGMKRMEFLRAQLLLAAVRFVREGKTNTPQDRLRLASDLSGVSRVAIENGLGVRK